MKKIILITCLFLITISTFSQEKPPEGFALNLGAGIGSGTHDGIKGDVIILYFGLNFIPNKAKFINYSLYLQNGGLELHDKSKSYNHSFIGLEIATKPLQDYPTRFQPYIGIRFGLGDAGTTGIGVFAPVVGLDFFPFGRFAINCGYRYDLYSGSPKHRASIFSFGIKFFFVKSK